MSRLFATIMVIKCQMAQYAATLNYFLYTEASNSTNKTLAISHKHSGASDLILVTSDLKPETSSQQQVTRSQ